MTNTAVETTPRTRYGVWSLVVAALAFSVAAVSFMVFATVPEDAAEQSQDFGASVFLWGFLAAAPLLHLVGLGLGMAALTRNGDSKRLAVLGIILNFAAVALGLGLVWLMLHVAAAFT